MEQKIANFVSPDLSHIDNHMNMVEAELGIISAEFNALKEVDAATGSVIREQINSVKLFLPNYKQTYMIYVWILIKIQQN